MSREGLYWFAENSIIAQSRAKKTERLCERTCAASMHSEDNYYTWFRLIRHKYIVGFSPLAELALRDSLAVVLQFLRNQNCFRALYAIQRKTPIARSLSL